jgi:myo-inositol-1(or 4)-monophosphatase
MDLKKTTIEICNIAEEAGNFIRHEATIFNREEIKQKDTHDFVSYVDINSEKLIVEKLSGLFPGAGFITEEGTTQKNEAEFTWVIDPLDGTTNFMHNIGLHSVSIGLTHKGEPVAGAILSVESKELFYGWKNGGAWMNNKRIHVSDTSSIGLSLLGTGFPIKKYARLDDYMKCLEYFIRNTSGVRRMGSVAIDLSWLACGRYDAFFEYGLNPWDVAAGIIILREAGGKISNFSGEEKNINGSEIVAANSILFDEVQRITGNFMNPNKQ